MRLPTLGSIRQTMQSCRMGVRFVAKSHNDKARVKALDALNLNDEPDEFVALDVDDDTAPGTIVVSAMWGTCVFTATWDGTQLQTVIEWGV